MKIICLGSLLWDSIWGHSQELSQILSKEHEVTYLEPVVHSSKLSLSFKRTTDNPIPNGVIIIKRDTNLGLNLIYGIYCELNNLYYLMKLDYDIFITYYSTCALFSTIFARLTGKKVVLMYVDDLSEWYKPKLAKFVTKYLFTPLVIKFSNFNVTTAHKLEEYVKNYNSNAMCIPNGVNLNFFQDNKFVSNNEKFIVGFIGSFGNRINYKLLIETAKLLKRDKKIKFLFAGGGDGYEILKNKIDEFKLDNIDLIGIVPHSEVPEILHEIDVGIIPFKINRLTDCISPLKLFEYWAMGKPVISTSFFEIKLIAKDSIIFADSPYEFSKAIKDLKNNEKIRLEYADKGHQEVKKYDWDVLGNKYLNLIDNL